jgi:high-affinity iron transporter
MRRQARSMGGALRSQVNRALEGGAVLGMASIAFIGVAREGLETALYMLTVFFDFGVVSTMIGAVAGLATAAALGYVFYRSSQSINLRLFFQMTAGLIILFAAGLLGRSIFHLQAAGVFDSLYWPVWDVTGNPIVGHGNTFAFLSGLFGWSAQPSIEQAASWVMYVTLACWFFYFDGQLPDVVTERVRPWANAIGRTFAMRRIAEADIPVDRDG